MAHITRGFEVYYKRLGPTGSVANSINGYLPTDWYNKNDVAGTVRVYQSFLNWNSDVIGTPSYSRPSTRNSGSATKNNTFRALPWSSHAADMLWNVTVPSWSFVDTSETDDVGAYTKRTWNCDLNTTQSFFKAFSATVGVSSYAITSSWKIYDPKMKSFNYRHNAYPTYVGAGNPIYAPFLSPPIYPTENSSDTSYDISFPSLTASFCLSPTDNAYFDTGAGAGITRASITSSLVTASISGSDDTATGLRHMTEALKARRLFFPTPYANSGATSGTDYFFTRWTGYQISDVFNTNGGIYNVQLTLKRYIPDDYYPDQGTFLSAFIHNVTPQIPSSSARAPGADGWYPPDNAIVKIGNGYNGGPTMTFIETQTGYLVEKFNFNVIQYGYPAQLCLEASGSTTTGFGIIVDDIQICKIGVTTDPAFLKPE